MYMFVRSAQSNVGVSAAARINRPPIVGVPAFGWWPTGPSARIIWPICASRIFRIIHGPNIKLIANAVRLAAAVRNVMYRMTFNIASCVWSGYSR